MAAGRHQRPPQAALPGAVHRTFFNDAPPDYVRRGAVAAGDRGGRLLQSEGGRPAGAKLGRGRPLGETDDMALAGIVSTQLVHRQFVAEPRTSPPLDERDDVKVVVRRAVIRREKLCP